MVFEHLNFEPSEVIIGKPNTYLVAEKVLTEQAQGKQVTKPDRKESFDDGPFKDIDVPNSWLRAEGHPFGRSTVHGFNAPDGKTSLNVYDRGVTTDDASAKAFSKLLTDNPNLSRPKVLMPNQIRALEDVLGRGKLGDNQYTNTTPYPDSQAPLFKLSSAQLVTVQGKTVLEVEGNYMDEKGQRTSHYKGLLVPEQTPNGVKIWELYMEAKEKDITPADHSNYRRAVNSIHWK